MLHSVRHIQGYHIYSSLVQLRVAISEDIITFNKMSQSTQLIYQKEGDKLLHPSKILSTIPLSNLPPEDQALVKDPTITHAIITDSTIFYVQGGGQPSDTGSIKPKDTSTPVFEVKSVRQPITGSQVLHLGQFTPNNESFTSNEITQHVNEETRTLHSRLHTAGHIMSLAIHALCKEGLIPPLKESKASHYPDSAAVLFEGLIEGKHKEAIQAKTNEFVQSARPVKIHWWTMEELLSKCAGVTDGFELPAGEVLGRVVEMEGLGSYPCGGTHVRDCSLVGRIVVKKISRSKGISRVSYAVEDV